MKLIKSFFDFWNKDIINKLIILVLLLLAGGTLAVAILIINMPQGKVLSEAFTSFLPVPSTPTFDVNSYLTPGANIPAQPASTESPLVLAFTSTPSALAFATPTTQIFPEATSTLMPTLPPPALTQVVKESPTPEATGPSGAECIPNTPPQTGRVVEILDGNTARILFIDNGLVYTVRYIGVVAPKDKIQGDLAKKKNGELVYGQGKEVVLIKDSVEKDERGRLLRYVLIKNIFVNMELLRQGFGSAADVPSGMACAQSFKQAEQSASSALLGIWAPTATPVLR